MSCIILKSSGVPIKLTLESRGQSMPLWSTSSPGCPFLLTSSRPIRHRRRIGAPVRHGVTLPVIRVGRLSECADQGYGEHGGEGAGERGDEDEASQQPGGRHHTSTPAQRHPRIACNDELWVMLMNSTGGDRDYFILLLENTCEGDSVDDCCVQLMIMHSIYFSFLNKLNIMHQIYDEYTFGRKCSQMYGVIKQSYC